MLFLSERVIAKLLYIRVDGEWVRRMTIPCTSISVESTFVVYFLEFVCTLLSLYSCMLNKHKQQRVRQTRKWKYIFGVVCLQNEMGANTKSLCALLPTTRHIFQPNAPPSIYLSICINHKQCGMCSLCSASKIQLRHYQLLLVCNGIGTQIWMA